jgi:hypothetical protein
LGDDLQEHLDRPAGRIPECANGLASKGTQEEPTEHPKDCAGAVKPKYPGETSVDTEDAMIKKDNTKSSHCNRDQC